MSYDLAVWEGDRPATDEAAIDEFRRLTELHMESADLTPPTARIAAYVQALLDRYPDIGTEAGDESPWAAGPLLEEASGPLIYFAMVWSRCEEVSAWAAQLAFEHGLVCYDPQLDQLRPALDRDWRFELTSAGGRPVRNPDAAALRKAAVQLTRDNFYAILTRDDGWFVQVGFGARAGTRPGWYALERQEGSTERHFRTELGDIEEVVAVLIAFAEDDPALLDRFGWNAYEL